MQAIRHSTVTLYNLQFTMNLVAKGGKAWTLPVSVHAREVDVRDAADHQARNRRELAAASEPRPPPASDVHPCSMSADGHGIPVNAGIVYYDPDSFFVKRPAFSRAFAKQGYLFPGSCEEKFRPDADVPG